MVCAIPDRWLGWLGPLDLESVDLDEGMTQTLALMSSFDAATPKAFEIYLQFAGNITATSHNEGTLVCQVLYPETVQLHITS